MKNRAQQKVQDIVLVGVLAAVIAVCSLFAIPTPWGMPFTLQTFAVALAGYLLGAKKGFLCILLYLTMGFIGLPIFSGFRGGAGVFMGVTGGFLYGFLVFGLLCGISGNMRNPFAAIIMGLVGLMLCHLLGVIHFSLISGSRFSNSFVIASLPFLWKDVLSILLAYIVAQSLKKALSFFFLGTQKQNVKTAK